LAGFEERREAFDEEGISVIAASVDDAEKSGEVQAELSFPVVHGVTREVADAVGAWWDGRRDYIQPSEFILGGGGRVLSATYSTGPVGRLDAQDALSLVKILKARSKKG
jgi:peroxiredoxin